MTARAGPMPVPARITLALEAIGAEGPEVDLTCGTWEGNPAGDVDAWERGDAVPTDAQVQALAAYARMPVEYFYLPPDEAEERGGRIFICDRRRRRHALTVVESRIGWDGVLQVDELVSPKSPYRPRTPRQEAPMAPRMTRPAEAGQQPVRGAHDPIPDPEAPGCCATCRRPIRIRRGGRDVLTPVHLPGPVEPDWAERAAGGDREDLVPP